MLIFQRHRLKSGKLVNLPTGPHEKAFTAEFIRAGKHGPTGKQIKLLKACGLPITLLRPTPLESGENEYDL